MPSKLEANIGYTFRDAGFLQLALTHSSYSNEKGLGHAGCNERLEFLGDSILGFTAADYLFHKYPDLPEGSLSKIRADYVCETNLARAAAAFELGSSLKLGHGEDATGGRSRPSVVSDAFESLIAAIFLDGGLKPAQDLIYKFILSEDMPEPDDTDYKSRLQELVQQKRDQQLTYILEGESGPDHSKQFSTVVMLNGVEIGRGTGKSKKKSEQEAAKNGLNTLNQK